MSSFLKDPAAVLDYGVDWSRWLATSETIATSTWTVAEATDGNLAGIAIDDDSATTTATTVWLSGGVVGVAYSLTNHIVTNNSPIAREDDRTIVITCKER